MSDCQYLECIHAALITYQKSRDEPSESVGRVVTSVERELEGKNLCPVCGREIDFICYQSSHIKGESP